MRRAQLPWYDFDFLTAEYAELWAALRRHLLEQGLEQLPERLDSCGDLDSVLNSSELLCSQTCGYDIAVGAPPLAMIFTPSYSAPGCSTGTYSSLVVAREDSRFQSLEDLRGARFV